MSGSGEIGGEVTLLAVGLVVEAAGQIDGRGMAQTRGIITLAQQNASKH